MNKICTDIEQSKKLVELGVDVNTADMVWVCGRLHTDGPRYQILRVKEEVNEPENYIPTWSLTALLELMPNGLFYNNHYVVPILLPQIKNNWICRLYDVDNNIDVAFIKDNPLDAAFEMICWLLENKKYE